MLGYEPLATAATRMVLGADSNSFKEGRAFGIQCLSGTGALRVGAEFLARIIKSSVVYSSNPTWGKLKFYQKVMLLIGLHFFKGNHKLIFLNAGFSTYRSYRYWSEEKKALDFEGMLEDIRAAPENAIIILHACAHNPTGVDPTQEQWKQIADVIEVRFFLNYTF